MSLQYIGQQITIYVGVIILVFGLIGNCINILVFTSVRMYRQQSCVLYFLNASIGNLLYLLVLLPSRILATGFGIDPTRTSLIWCKLRSFWITVYSQITLFSICFATINQYILTSRNARIRRLSTTKSTCIIILLLNLFWILHGILPVIFYEISPVTKSCTYANTGYEIYAQFYLVGLNTSIPVFILLLFTYLTWRNLQKTRFLVEQGVDRQLLRMVFFQVALVLIFIFPYGLLNAYSLATQSITKTIDRILIESFVWTIITLWTYLFYSTSCYVFLFSSKRFRSSAKQQIEFLCLQLGRVHPL